MRGLPVLLLVPMLVLAGCFSADEAAPAEDAPAVVPEGGAIAPDGSVLVAARYLEGASPVDVTTWLNGTFTVEQHNRPHNTMGLLPPVREPTVVEHDITPMIPKGYPAKLIVEINAELERGDVDVWPRFPDGEWRTGNWNSPRGGFTRFEASFIHTSNEPVTLVVMYDELEDQDDVPYTLMARVVGDPSIMSKGIPTAIDLPAGATLSVEEVGERPDGPAGTPTATSIMVFAPDDEFLGAFPLSDGPTTIDLGVDAPEGEYVLLLPQSGRDARVLVAAEEATLRPLAIEWLMGDVHVGDTPGHVAWTFEHTRAPILAGVHFRSPNVAMDVQVTLKGPLGPMIDGRSTGGPWLSWRPPVGDSLDSSFWWDNGFGAAGLAPGIYEAEVTFTQAAGTEHPEGQSVAAFYVR